MSKQSIEQLYPNGAPIVVQIAFQRGYGSALTELNRKVYLNDSLSICPAILEAIQCICLSSCDNQYCAVMHARGMVAAGFSLQEVQTLVETQRLPPRIENRENWEHVLRRVAILFNQPKSAPGLYSSLKEFVDEQTTEEIGGIIAFSLLHKFLLELYSEEIDISDEPILFETVDCGEELIRYFIQRGNQQVPVFTICSVCKDLKTEAGWVPLEAAIESLPGGSSFSHGICQSCATRWRNSA